jgi:hypothetical protein
MSLLDCKFELLVKLDKLEAFLAAPFAPADVKRVIEVATVFRLDFIPKYEFSLKASLSITKITCILTDRGRLSSSGGSVVSPVTSRAQTRNKI